MDSKGFTRRMFLGPLFVLPNNSFAKGLDSKLYYISLWTVSFDKAAS